MIVNMVSPSFLPEYHCMRYKCQICLRVSEKGKEKNVKERYFA